MNSLMLCFVYSPIFFSVSAAPSCFPITQLLGKCKINLIKTPLGSLTLYMGLIKLREGNLSCIPHFLTG